MNRLAGRLVDARAVNSFLFGNAAGHTSMALMATAIYKAPEIAQFLERPLGAVITPEFSTAMLGLATWNVLLLAGTIVLAGGLYIVSRQVRTPAHDRLQDMAAFVLGFGTSILTGFLAPSQIRFNSPPARINMNL